MQNQEEDHTRGTVISVAIGLLASILGGMLLAAASSAPPHDQQVLSGLGIFLLVIGGPMFFIGVLIELFAIRPIIQSTLKSNEEVLSLLKSRPAGPQASEMSVSRPIESSDH